MPPTLHFYVISTPTFANRIKNITAIMRWMKEQCDAHTLPIQFHSLTQPSVEDVSQLIQSKHPQLEPRIQPIPLANSHPVYAKLERPLNTAELSNYERHRTALQAIAKGSPDDFHFVIEDDLYIIPIFESHWTAFFKMLKTILPRDYPLVLFGVVKPEPAGGTPTDFKFQPYKELPLTEQQPLLPSKEMYLVHPSLASTLYDATHLIQYDMRHTLSRWILEHTMFHDQIYIPSKRLAFDGSKLGIFPSTIHANNLLLFNQEFMEMLQIMSQPPDKKNKANIQRIYKSIERLQSPDAQHLYAVLMYQIGDYDEASDYFKKAIDTMIANKGFLSRQSEMLHNAIEFYKHYQKEDLGDLTTRPSKYQNAFKPSLQASAASAASSSVSSSESSK